MRLSLACSARETMYNVCARRPGMSARYAPAFRAARTVTVDTLYHQDAIGYQPRSKL
jgi:hypothetical protein